MKPLCRALSGLWWMEHTRRGVLGEEASPLAGGEGMVAGAAQEKRAGWASTGHQLGCSARSWESTLLC